MYLFPQDGDLVLYETGFEDDLLGRRTISKQLSDLVERIEDPLVIALDDKWGSGKTFFLKRWVAAHSLENEGRATTVYFDAFENDYLSDPLVSIIAAVSLRIPDEGKKTLERWKAAAKKLARPALAIGLNLATFGAKQHLDDMGDIVAETIGSEVKGAALDLWDAERARKDAMIAFKDLLSDLTSKTEAPIVIVVDELDRCRPDYALSVLEVIKHFFSVPKVHFILGVNGQALENTVKARYGGDIDAERYLRKFINLSFSLPQIIDRRNGTQAIVTYASQASSEMELPKKVSERTINLLGLVARNEEVSLRDVGKVLARIALLPSDATRANLLDGWRDVLCVLIVSSVVRPDLHKAFLSGEASLAMIMDFLGTNEPELTYPKIDQHNQSYNHNTTLWFVSIVFCCSPVQLTDLGYLPDWSSRVGTAFDNFGRHHDPKKIPNEIQKLWVDVFRS
ncbi:KAP family P-loop NTPase fold protein [Roseovarius sp. MS2]|uniref:KAP family P-loop NTPase fold protein n=1 Tax=Roseovarius sp. MS2 TaxID=3390728 RepID=UPI003F5C74BB